jgi:hypothetical protein
MSMPRNRLSHPRRGGVIQALRDHAEVAEALMLDEGRRGAESTAVTVRSVAEIKLEAEVGELKRAPNGFDALVEDNGGWKHTQLPVREHVDHSIDEAELRSSILPASQRVRFVA